MSAKNLQQRNRELTLLNHISQALNRTVAIDDALQLILTEAADYFELETGWIWLLRPEDDEHYLAAAVNLPPAFVEEPTHLTGWCWCIEVYRDGDMDSAELVRTIHCTRLRDLLSGTNGLNFHASIPLNAGDQRLGLLNLASSERPALTDYELDLLHTIGDMLAIAVERNRLFEQSRQLGVMSERNRLAREIHDTLAQSLTGIALQLESAELTLPTNPAQSASYISKALTLSRNSLDEARRSVVDLRASPLEGRTLADALRLLAETHSFKTELKFVDPYSPLPADVAMGIYRIAGEALNNIAKHAGVAKASLRLVQLPTSVELTIRDDGVGFSAETTHPNHFGLTGMSERARLLGGTMTIESAPGRGTKLTTHIPL